MNSVPFFSAKTDKQMNGLQGKVEAAEFLLSDIWSTVCPWLSTHRLSIKTRCRGQCLQRFMENIYIILIYIYLFLANYTIAVSLKVKTCSRNHWRKSRRTERWKDEKFSLILTGRLPSDTVRIAALSECTCCYDLFHKPSRVRTRHKKKKKNKHINISNANNKERAAMENVGTHLRVYQLHRPGMLPVPNLRRADGKYLPQVAKHTSTSPSVNETSTVSFFLSGPSVTCSVCSRAQARSQVASSSAKVTCGGFTCDLVQPAGTRSGASIHRLNVLWLQVHSDPTETNRVLL